MGVGVCKSNGGVGLAWRLMYSSLGLLRAYGMGHPEGLLVLQGWEARMCWYVQEGSRDPEKGLGSHWVTVLQEEAKT